jgi:hypothetical protein
MTESRDIPSAENDAAPYNLSEFQAVELMMRTLVKNAVLCNKGEEAPDVSNLQRGIQMLPRALAEQVGSAKRYELIDAIDARKPHEGWLKRSLRQLYGTKAEHPGMESEVQWLKEHGDQTSFTMLATQADMEMKLGNADEAKETYSRALRAAREGGYDVTE